MKYDSKLDGHYWSGLYDSKRDAVYENDVLVDPNTDILYLVTSKQGVWMGFYHGCLSDKPHSYNNIPLYTKANSLTGLLDLAQIGVLGYSPDRIKLEGLKFLKNDYR